MNFFNTFTLMALILAIILGQTRADWDTFEAELEKIGKQVEEMGKAFENFDHPFFKEN
ncbi:cecropin-A1-like [Drosophila grimshawi]|uniref:cecropin-A1-like n=1 Tax=Drosophila grimshawi TaxID=7222 RepID=UPI000C86F01F|nr:cecropin-A1-like [Drosophila grimshawi]